MKEYVIFSLYNWIKTNFSLSSGGLCNCIASFLVWQDAVSRRDSSIRRETCTEFLDFEHLQVYVFASLRHLLFKIKSMQNVNHFLDEFLWKLLQLKESLETVQAGDWLASERSSACCKEPGPIVGCELSVSHQWQLRAPTASLSVVTGAEKIKESGYLPSLGALWMASRILIQFWGWRRWLCSTQEVFRTNLDAALSTVIRACLGQG